MDCLNNSEYVGTLDNDTYEVFHFVSLSHRPNEQLIRTPAVTVHVRVLVILGQTPCLDSFVNIQLYDVQEGQCQAARTPTSHEVQGQQEGIIETDDQRS
jgi:hypothetical protein